MRITRTAILAGAALLGLGVAAVAESPKVHVMKVALPDGSVQEVRYTGKTPPRIVVAADPFAGAMGAGLPGFADFDRISAAMDAQMAAMMHQADAMRQAAFAQAQSGGQPAGLQATGAAAAPAGSQFSYVSSTTVNGKTCTTSVHQVAGQGGAQPQLFRQVSGDGCTAAQTRQQGLIPTSAAATPQTPLAPAAAPKAPAAPVAPRAPTVPRDTI